MTHQPTKIRISRVLLQDLEQKGKYNCVSYILIFCLINEQRLILCDRNTSCVDFYISIFYSKELKRKCFLSLPSNRILRHNSRKVVRNFCQIWNEKKIHNCASYTQLFGLTNKQESTLCGRIVLTFSLRFLTAKR